jgi:hypothetical protein
MKIRWGIQIRDKGQVVSINQFFLDIPDEELAVCETTEEKTSLIEYYVNKEFECNSNTFWEEV